MLGEQSQSALRGKKTEDVIFAGGNGKAPSGLAEVTVTFDNATGWLPTEFTEVTVTRRAFRSGDNQYLINGRKVRLKDVAHLTRRARARVTPSSGRAWSTPRSASGPRNGAVCSSTPPI